MKKNFVFCSILLITLLSISFCIAQSSSIKISPLKTELDIKLWSEQNCKIFYVIPDKNLQVTTRWSRNFPGEEDSYNLSREQIRLKINYTKLEYGKYEFCFEPQKEGMFYGLIFFQPEESLVRMGTWINLNVTSKSPAETISLITGNVIGKTNKVNVGLGIVFFLLLIIFSLIIKRTFIDKHS